MGCMSWAIVWTAWPGVLRVGGYIKHLALGDFEMAAAGCQRLLSSNMPAYCAYTSFVQSNVGIGDRAAYWSYNFVVVAGILVTAFGSKCHCVDWGVFAGNMVIAFLLTIGQEYLIAAPYNIHEGTILSACFSCIDPTTWCTQS